MEFLAVDEVEDLHHDECVEHEGKVSGKDSVLQEDILIVLISTHIFESTTPHSASHNSILPLVLGMGSENGCVVGIHVFGNNLLTCEHQNHHHDQLENSLSNDVFEHCGRNDVLVSRMWRSVQQIFSWWLSGKSQRPQSVHDQVHPQHLNGLQDLLFDQSSPD